MISEKQSSFIIRKDVIELVSNREEFKLGKKEYLKSKFISKTHFHINEEWFDDNFNQTQKEYISERIYESSLRIYGEIKRKAEQGYFSIGKVNTNIKLVDIRVYKFEITCEVYYNEIKTSNILLEIRRELDKKKKQVKDSDKQKTKREEV